MNDKSTEKCYLKGVTRMVVSKEGNGNSHSNTTKTTKTAICASLVTIELSLSPAMSF